MTEAEKMLIEAFAAGDSTLRSEAIEIHRRNISSDGVRGTLHQRFMAEIDHPAPDLVLRAKYRAELLR